MNLRNRYVALVCTAVCVAAVVLCWQHKVHANRAVVVAPYTAHLTITENRVLTNGSSWNGVKTETLARDRQGRLYEKQENVSRIAGQTTESSWVLVQDQAKLQTLTWDSNSKVAVMAHWPYWSGRKGCWADEHGQQRASFPTDEDWYKIPASVGEGKLETIASVAAGEKRVKTRVVTENLGEKEIHGLTAYGMRTTMTPLEDGGPLAMPETTTELWKSREFDLKLLEVMSGPKYGLKRVELSDLQRSDPDPTLFKPPLGYKVEPHEYHQVSCKQ